MHHVEIDSIIAVILTGVIVLAFIYHIVLYIFSRDKLLIHYLFYIFFTGIFVFSRSSLIAFWFGMNVEDFCYDYLSEPIQILYLATYFNFVLQSVEIHKTKSSFLYRSWIFIMTILLSYSVIFFFLKLNNKFITYPIPFISIRIFIFILTSIMLWQCYKLRHITFQFFILIGCTFYFIIGVISFITNMNIHENMTIYPPEWLMIGSFVDIVLFSIAMSYRNKKQWETMNLTLLDDANKIIAFQKEVLDKQLALEDERARIARDMHDDLGSGLTKIRYLSQVDLKDENAKSNMLKIKTTASDLVDNMSEIIWAMKEENDSLEDLITYIKIYAVDYFELNNKNTTIIIPENIENRIVKGDTRRNLFLAIKETFHNIIKHAEAKNILVTIEINQNLFISIKDDGKGFNEIKSTGNGIKNIKNRIKKINGQFEIQSTNGTLVVFTIPIENLV